jgi:prepilin-type N-terminal cleavage/methylation domain-containing protein
MGRGRGFTLLELLAVVVIVGLVATALATSVGAPSDGARRGRAMESLRDFLAIVRVEALQRREAREARVWIEDGRLRASDGVRDRAWRAPGLLFSTEGLDRDGARRLIETGARSVRFSPAGRTIERRWVFDATASGGTIHELTFDPISSAPSIPRRD